MKRVIVCVLSAALVGCSPSKYQPERADPPHATAAPHAVIRSYPDSLKILASTPDLALKSWWRVVDADADFEFQWCTQEQAQESPLVHYRAAILTGEVSAYFSKYPSACSKEVYERSIDDVKIESDSRATILATVKNVTPTPNGTTLQEWEQKLRDTGEKLRYIMERESSQQPWRVSQIFRYDTLAAAKPQWRPEYDLKWQDHHINVYGQ